MAAPNIDERIREWLESLQHSHVQITQTTKGVTFEVKVRNPSARQAAQEALDIYLELKEKLQEVKEE